MRAFVPVLLVTVALILGSQRPLLAQIAFDRDRDQAVGGVAGLASGAGISYQEILPSALGYRGALALWKVGDFSFVDIGVSGLRVLSDDGRQRVYLVASLAYWRRKSEETEPLFDDDGNVTGERVFDDVDDSWALGLGAGLETPLGERVAVSIEAVFTYWADSESLLPLPQFGIHYQF